MAYVKIFHIHKYNKQKYYRLAEKALKDHKIPNMDLCACTTCMNALHKKVKEETEINKENVNYIKITRISVLNNIFSNKCTSSHLNIGHKQHLDSQEDQMGKESTRAKLARMSNTANNKEYIDYSSLLVVNVGLNGYKCNFLADTGSEVDAISPDFLEKCPDCYDPGQIEDTNVILQMADKEVIGSATKVLRNARIDLFPNKSTREHKTNTDLLLLNLQNSEFDGILGISTLAKLGIKLQIPKMDSFNDDAQRANDEHLHTDYILHEDTDDDDIVAYIKDELEANGKLTIDQWGIFPKGKIEFELTPEQIAKAYKTRSNYVALQFFDATDEQVDEWKRLGVIELNHETTPLNLPLLAVRQNNTDGTLRKVRICIDFRGLNQFLSMDSYKLPKFQEVAAEILGSTIFTAIDLSKGYNQIEVAESCRKYMCFQWRGKQYRFKGCPFGLNFLPSKFNRWISHLFVDLDGVIVYIDDIFIFHKDKAKHAATVKEVLKRLNDANMVINRDKSQFGRSKVTYLGFNFSANGISVDPARTQRLVNYEVPRTGKELHSFLCMANYIRQHIPNYAQETAVLYEIANQRKKLAQCKRWQAEGLPAWERLTEMLKSPMILKYPDPNRPYRLRTDACVTGFGGYLYQINDEGEEDIIHIFSQHFKAEQRGYSIPKKELFAILYAVRHLRFYLGHAKVYIQTDAKCLSRLYEKTIECDTVAKWLFEISEIDYEIEHLPGRLNIFADALSRQAPDTVLDTWRHKQPSFLEPANLKHDKHVDKDGKVEHTFTQPTAKRMNHLRSYPTHIRQKILSLRRRVAHGTMTGTKIPFNADTFTNDWKLHQQHFQMAQSKWGAHTIDMFAASHNAQLDRYYTHEINALAQSWRKENPWCNPPWHLISRVLQKVKRDKVTATICVPFYRHATWWSQLKRITIDDPIAIARNENIFLRNGTETVGNTPWETTLLVRISGDPAVQAKPNIDWSFENYRHKQETEAQMHLMKTKHQKQIKTMNTMIQTLQKEVHQLQQDNEHPVTSMDWLSTTEAQAANAQIHAVRTRSATAREKAKTAETEQATLAEPTQIQDQAELQLPPVPEPRVFMEPDDIPELPQLGDAGAETQLTFSQKWQIVRRYHRLTHQHHRTVAEEVRRTGKYRWEDLAQIAQDVEDHCRHCELKRIEKEGYHPLRSRRSRFAGDVWVMDLIQVPRYQDDNDGEAFILHIIDHWSGYSWLRPLQTKAADHIAHHVVNIMAEHGCPVSFWHDNAQEFTSKLMKEVITEVAGAMQVLGVPYHAQSQGVNERKHRQIKDSIIELLNTTATKGRDWKVTIPFVQLKTNLQVNKRHGSTPFAAYYGRTHNLCNTNEAIKSVDDWLHHMETMDRYIIPSLTAKMNKYWDTQERHFLNTHTEETIEYERNQIVKVRTCGQKKQSAHGKLSYQWKGPFKILKKVRGGYDITYINTRKDNQKVNSRPVPPEEISAWRNWGAIQTSDDWVVAKITDSKSFQGKELQYYCHWEGNWKPSWEPASNIPSWVRDSYHKLVRERESRTAKMNTCHTQRLSASKVPLLTANSNRRAIVTRDLIRRV